jgi:hypothetical protein
MIERRLVATARDELSTLGIGVFVAHPTTGPAWKLRAALVLLLAPRRSA